MRRRIVGRYALLVTFVEVVGSEALTVTKVRAGLARAVALLSIGLVAGGCTLVTGGKAQIPPRFIPRSVTGPTIAHVLVGDNTLSRILNQPFTIDARIPPRFGGPETLQGFGSDSPGACLGVAEMLHQSVYQSGKVNDVAVEAWRHAARSTELTGVKEGVVSLATPADANALFSRFSQQWQRCDGQELPLPDPVLRLTARISSVQVAPHVLAATLSITFAGASIPAGRAVGVRDNCLVEVEVDYFNASTASVQELSTIKATSVRIAQIMMNKVSKLN
jgi:PknH-like extracellular domain